MKFLQIDGNRGGPAQDARPMDTKEGVPPPTIHTRLIHVDCPHNIHYYRDTQRYTDTGSYRQIKRGAERYREGQRDTERHRDIHEGHREAGNTQRDK